MSSSADAVATFAPMSFLRSLTGKRIVVKTKWGPQYIGTLVSCDAHMNVQLAGCLEYTDDESQPAGMEAVVIRCNNVLYFRQVPDSVTDPLAIVVKA